MTLEPPRSHSGPVPAGFSEVFALGHPCAVPLAPSLYLYPYLTRVCIPLRCIASDISLNISSASVRVVATILPKTHAIATATVTKLNEFSPSSLEGALGNGYQVMSIQSATITHVTNVVNVINVEHHHHGSDAGLIAGVQAQRTRPRCTHSVRAPAHRRR